MFVQHFENTEKVVYKFPLLLLVNMWLRSRWFYTLWETDLWSPPHLSGSPQLPLKQFQCWSNWWRPFLDFSRKFTQCFLCLLLSPPSDQWCHVLSFVQAFSVSRSSTLQIIQDARHLCWLPLPACLPAWSFPLPWHAQDTSAPSGVFKQGCWTLPVRASCFFSLFVAGPVSTWGRPKLWSACQFSKYVGKTVTAWSVVSLPQSVLCIICPKPDYKRGCQKERSH